ncbi:MAG: hypothetical protein UW24_C0005G0021 [Parcubacteria group bacterium GW2011_GWA2_44_12]|nr:MAG: hypothetical protein UW24_C0005G0021 [Parcubacteria group bacterium GW2011_GWA2_44_12]
MNFDKATEATPRRVFLEELFKKEARKHLPDTDLIEQAVSAVENTPPINRRALLMYGLVAGATVLAGCKGKEKPETKTINKLIADLDSGDKSVRLLAAQVLARAGQYEEYDITPAMVALADILNNYSEDGTVRTEVAFALTFIKSSKDEPHRFEYVINILRTNALIDKSWFVQHYLLNAMRNLIGNVDVALQMEVMNQMFLFLEYGDDANIRFDAAEVLAKAAKNITISKEQIAKIDQLLIREQNEPVKDILSQVRRKAFVQ